MQALDMDKDPAVLGPFELLAVLGQGGMGRTYLARRLRLADLAPELEAAYHLTDVDERQDGGPVLAAVKVIKPDKLTDGSEHSEQQARARFGQEIETMRTVVSSRVPSLLASDAEAARPWLAMDYVHGPTLHQLVHACGPLEVGPYAALGLALVEALRAIHEVKLLHRDLKPGNIAIGPDGPVVLDFGLAVLTERDSAEALTKTGTGFGTPAYMSLEQATDAKHVQEPTDIYSLGAVLYFAATRRTAFPHGPIPVEPSWERVPSPFVPLLSRMLVHVAVQRPLLGEIEQGLVQLLAQHGLTPQDAAEQLRALVDASGLVPVLPAGALADEPDPAVELAAQRAVDEGDRPDAPWASADDLFAEFLAGEEAAEKLPAAAEGADAPGPAVAPAEYVPTVVDQEARQAPGAGTSAEDPAKVTSYRLAPPNPAPDPVPAEPVASGPPPAALRAAESLRRAYAHSGRL
ncbi:protein kinase domain-containing protein [Streptomyces viridosporus]|uniref:protein kinase domain-containing protein n=1 Tax=Streptomyces viridosporus TaxID=67581 RepID=UPI0033196C9F